MTRPTLHKTRSLVYRHSFWTSTLRPANFRSYINCQNVKNKANYSRELLSNTNVHGNLFFHNNFFILARRLCPGMTEKIFNFSKKARLGLIGPHKFRPTAFRLRKIYLFAKSSFFLLYWRKEMFLIPLWSQTAHRCNIFTAVRTAVMMSGVKTGSRCGGKIFQGKICEK